MRGRTQLYDLWPQRNGLIVPVLCPVIQSNLYAQFTLVRPRLRFAEAATVKLS
jgi:hypothetical protein